MSLSEQYEQWGVFNSKNFCVRKFRKRPDADGHAIALRRLTGGTYTVAFLQPQESHEPQHS